MKWVVNKLVGNGGGSSPVCGIRYALLEGMKYVSLAAINVVVAVLISGCTGASSQQHKEAEVNSPQTAVGRCPAVLVPGISLSFILPADTVSNSDREVRVVFKHTDGRQASVVWKGDSYTTEQEDGLFLIDKAERENLPESGSFSVTGPTEAGDFDVSISVSDFKPVHLPSVHVDAGTCSPTTKSVTVSLEPQA